MRPEAVHLKDEAERAVELLSDLCKPQPPQKPLGDLNPKAIKHCRVCSFCVNAWCSLNLYLTVFRNSFGMVRYCTRALLQSCIRRTGTTCIATSPELLC